MGLQSVVEQCVTDLGYELVDIEHGPGGLLRVFIDVVPGSDANSANGEPDYVRIEDCERVSHQLTHLFTVENVDYARLEISSPGLDRPLNKPSDFQRFEGFEATVRLRRPLGGRKNFEGVVTVEDDGRFGLILADGKDESGKGGKGGKTGRGAKAGKGGKGKSNAKTVNAKSANAKAANADGATVDALTAAGSAEDSKDGALPVAAGDASAPSDGGADGAVETLRKLVFALDEIDRARLVPKVKF